MPIRLLSDHISSMIAAGEVIERPASVVKELVENALDAGATEISVDIQGGGIEHIRVADNGCGIPYDEVELAFQRFATSKIAGAEDLDAIATLGFRGEALPSIASVARVSLTTRAAGADTGARLEISENVIGEKRPIGAAQGTVFSVRQLFRNVPARRKFLRTPATETTHILALATRYALAYPEVAFRLNAARPLLATPGSGSLREAIAAAHSLDVADAMLELAADNPDEPDNPANPRGGNKSVARVGIDGMVSRPHADRANRGYMNFFVNRRWVQSRMLSYALEQAYHGFLKERRFPIAVVNISLDYADVDVNAHPAKTEVRFRRGDAVFSAVQQAVRHTLTAQSPVHAIRSAAYAAPPAWDGVSRPKPAPSRFWGVEPFQSASANGGGNGVTNIGDGAPQPRQDASVALTPKQTLPALRVLGQIHNTYIVAEGPDGVYLIDQHAAHERVMFERIKDSAASGSPESQSLLQPITIELTPRQQEIAQAHQPTFAALGLLVEPFGGNVYLMRGVPSILADADPGKAFVDMLDEMMRGGDVESWSDRAAYSLSCHAAIRAGKQLAHEEMSALTRQLERCRQPHTCPHGRPTVIHMSAARLEREFGRR